MQPSSLAARSTDRRLGLGAKLAAGFATMAIIIAMIGVLSIDRLAMLEHAMSDIRDNYLPSANASAALEMQVLNLRRLELRYLITTPAEEAKRSSLRAEVASDEAAVARSRIDYEPVIDAGEERNRFTSEFDDVLPA